MKLYPSQKGKMSTAQQLRDKKHLTSIQKESQLCIHHWLIDCKDFGTCLKCGATKDFRELQRLADLHKTSQSRSSLGGQRSKTRRQNNRERRKANANL